MSKHVFRLPLVLVTPHSSSSCCCFTSLFELGPHYGENESKQNHRIKSLSQVIYLSRSLHHSHTVCLGDENFQMLLFQSQ